MIVSYCKDDKEKLEKLEQFLTELDIKHYINYRPYNINITSIGSKEKFQVFMETTITIFLDVEKEEL